MRVQLNVIQRTDGHRSVLEQTNKQKQRHIFKTMTTQHAPGANDTTPAHNAFPFIFQCHPFSCRKDCVEDRKRASLIMELILVSGNMFRACWLRTRCSSADSLFPVETGVIRYLLKSKETIYSIHRETSKVPYLHRHRK